MACQGSELLLPAKLPYSLMSLCTLLHVRLVNLVILAAVLSEPAVQCRLIGSNACNHVIRSKLFTGKGYCPAETPAPGWLQASLAQTHQCHPPMQQGYARAKAIKGKAGALQSSITLSSSWGSTLSQGSPSMVGTSRASKKLVSGNHLPSAL